MNLAFCDTVFEIKDWERLPADTCPTCLSKGILKVRAQEWCVRDPDEKMQESGFYTEQECRNCGQQMITQQHYSCTTWA